MPLSGWVNGNETRESSNAEHCYGILVTSARSAKSNEHVQRTFTGLIAQCNARQRTPAPMDTSCVILKEKDPVRMGGDRVTPARRRSLLPSSMRTVLSPLVVSTGVRVLTVHAVVRRRTRVSCIEQVSREGN